MVNAHTSRSSKWASVTSASASAWDRRIVVRSVSTWSFDSGPRPCGKRSLGELKSDCLYSLSESRSQAPTSFSKRKLCATSGTSFPLGAAPRTRIGSFCLLRSIRKSSAGPRGAAPSSMPIPETLWIISCALARRMDFRLSPSKT
eukprot:scaffold613_cov243-Pinguiococcus_pyrenoidosus.AAC.6